jgi:hypothetical protein
MSTIIVALFAGFVATTMGVLSLRKFSRPLKVRAQTFKFHELRDRLQLLAVDGKIEQASATYDFLQFTLNLALKNAGVMKLSEMLKLSRIIDRKMKVTEFYDVLSELRRKDEEVQKLAADMFNALGYMLISNDDFTFIIAMVIELAAKQLKGAAFEVTKKMVHLLPPERSQAVQEARKYKRFGDLLDSGHAA